jgi:probable rRNA maturation factor
MKLLLVNNSRDRVPEAWLAKWVRGLSRELAKRGHKRQARLELVCAFVTSLEMKRLNRQFRDRAYATDVLSFESMDPTSAGELVLCLPVIRRQARRTGLGERGELGYMIVHGALHLLGYDHETSAADEAKMFALQDLIYARLEKSVGLK